MASVLLLLLLSLLFNFAGILRGRRGVSCVFICVFSYGHKTEKKVMYGNPNLKVGDKWVAVQFRSTLLRVGTPWAACSDDDVQADAAYPVGSIMPILFGGPNLNSIALLAGNPSYLDVISELTDVTVPVKVVLEIFNKDKKTYTDSQVDGVCYKVRSKLLAFAKLVSHIVHGTAGCLVSWSDGSRIVKARHEFTCSGCASIDLCLCFEALLLSISSVLLTPRERKALEDDASI